MVEHHQWNVNLTVDNSFSRSFRERTNAAESPVHYGSLSAGGGWHSLYNLREEEEEERMKKRKRGRRGREEEEEEERFIMRTFNTLVQRLDPQDPPGV